MEGSFACPECGSEIRLTGLSPGREVVCKWCSSLVEVPYIPRADQIRRLRRDRYGSAPWWSWRLWPFWAKGAAVLLGAALVISLGVRVVVSRWKSAEATALQKLMNGAENAASEGRFGDALVEIETALTRASATSPRPACLNEVRRRRDEIARRDAEAQIEVLGRAASTDSYGAQPGTDVGRAMTLQVRTVRDPALAGLEPAIEALLVQLRERWVASDAVEAVRAFDEGRPDRAMELCERQYRTADELPKTRRVPLQADAGALARRVIAAHGTIIDAVRGQFTRGTPESYASLLRPPLFDALKRRGYLPRPVQPVWPEMWAEAAPFRVETEVIETFDDPYLQSPNRTTFIEGKIALLHGRTTLWRDNPRSKTQIPLPRLPAYQASRVAVSTHRSADFEWLLYENARAGLFERLGSSLRNVPICPAPAVNAPATASTH